MEEGPQAKLHTVLVGTDLSARAGRALARAVRLPLAKGATVLLVHVLPRQLPASFGDEVEDGVRTALQREENLLRKYARAAGRGDLVIRAELSRGDPAPSLSKLCRKEGAQLVVVGRHGQRSFKDQLLGTTAEKLIRQSPLPVLVVGDAPARAYARPLAAVDAEASAARVLEAALEVAPAGQRPLRVVHAYEHGYDLVLRTVNAPRSKFASYRRESLAAAEQKLSALLTPFEQAGARFRVLLDPKDARAAIPEAAGLERADLLVLGTHGRKGMQHLFLGSVAQAVLRRAQVDVLVVPTCGAQDAERKVATLRQRGAGRTLRRGPWGGEGR